MPDTKKAQTTLEYAVVIICVIAALLAMQVYLKRGFQGRLRGAADSIGEQYAPGNTTSDLTTTFSSSSTTTVTTSTDAQGRDISTTIVVTPEGAPDTQARSGTETVGALEKSLY